jgi:hypothetical protein
MTAGTTTPGPAASSTASTRSTTGTESSPRRRGRENAATKALRLLTEGRLRVKRVEGDLVIATCKGDSGRIYDLGFDPRNAQWRCTCEARSVCSHLRALQLVTAVGS